MCYNPSYQEFSRFGEGEGFSYSDVDGTDMKIFERYFTT